MSSDPSQRALANGLAAARDGAFGVADREFLRLACLAPGVALSFSNRGWILKRLHRFEEALNCYEKAVRLAPADPEVHWNYSLTLLQAGRVVEGFREYEWRWLWDKLPSKRREVDVPLWQPLGEPDEIVWIHGEQGFGDTLQFARWIPELAKRCKKVYLEVQPELFDLFARQHWPCEILRQPNVPGDMTRQLPIMSIPFVLNLATVQQFDRPPYLDIERSGRSGASAPLRRVGVVWRGRPTHGNDDRRSLSLAQFRPLFDIAGIQWISLNPLDLSAEIEAAGLTGRLDCPLQPGDSFTATADLIDTLDLVITVDTSAAHLAGAMGVPCWLLLPHTSDWRWGITGETTAWYGSLRLFRCPADLAWHPVIAQVTEMLQRQFASRAAPEAAAPYPLMATDARAQREEQACLVVDSEAELVGSVRLESPFRVWNCMLHEFCGGAFSYVGPGARLRLVSLGRYCSIGNQVEILSRHPTTGLTTSPFPYQRLFPSPFDAAPAATYENLANTRLGHDVWIGAGVRIKSGVTVGNGAIIGAGSVVTKDVPPFAIVAGTPAKLIRMRFPDKLVERIESLAWWQYNLLGRNIPTENPEAALDAIETAIAADGGWVPFLPGYFRIWRENGQIKATREAAPQASGERQ